jgi:hypothetical protein
MKTKSKNNSWLFGFAPYIKIALMIWLPIVVSILIGIVCSTRDEIEHCQTFIFLPFMMLLLAFSLIASYLVALLKRDLYAVSIAKDNLVLYSIHTPKKVIPKPIENFSFSTQLTSRLAMAINLDTNSTSDNFSIDGDFLTTNQAETARHIVIILKKLGMKLIRMKICSSDTTIIDTIVSIPKALDLLENA